MAPRPGPRNAGARPTQGRTPRAALAATFVAIVATQPDPATGQADRSALLGRGWSVLRAMDCARCHGRHYDGWTAPSLLAAARELPREQFDRMVLDGNVVRGMPGYRSQTAVTQALDAIHAYLLARARGEIGPADPRTQPAPPGPGR